MRAASFLIADGVLPSNEGRGYVLRRIMRRAMRHAHILGARDPVMYRLFPALARQMGDAYPELTRAEALITETLRLEETKFKNTLDNGLKLLAENSSALKSGAVFPGDVAFKLYDTFGFPLDLTEDALRPRGIAVDTKAFEAAMQKQKEAARAAWKGSGDAATETVWFEIKDKTGATEFLGYDTETAEGVVSALVAGGKETKSLKAGDEGAIVVNQTPFYGESGGQIGDVGVIKGAERRGVPCRRRRRKSSVICSCISARLKRAASHPATPSNSALITRAVQQPAPTTRPPTCCTKRFAKCSAPTLRKRARSFHRIACGSISRTPSRCRRTK